MLLSSFVFIGIWAYILIVILAVHILIYILNMLSYNHMYNHNNTKVVPTITAIQKKYFNILFIENGDIDNNKYSN